MVKVNTGLFCAFALLAINVCTPVVAAPRVNPLEISITYSEKLEKEFQRNYGVREKRFIEQTIQKELSDELGANAARVEVNVINVMPNRPTIEQMDNHPGLSMQSFSIGGAELSGRAFDANGVLLRETQYEYTSPSIFDAQYASTWNDTDYAIYRFAKRLGSN